MFNKLMELMHFQVIFLLLLFCFVIYFYFISFEYRESRDHRQTLWSQFSPSVLVIGMERGYPNYVASTHTC